MNVKIMRFAVLFAGMTLVATSVNAATCESLTALSLPNTTITLAQTVSAGTFTAPGSTAVQANPSLANLPAFCRVAATLRPVSARPTRPTPGGPLPAGPALSGRGPGTGRLFIAV